MKNSTSTSSVISSNYTYIVYIALPISVMVIISAIVLIWIKARSPPVTNELGQIEDITGRNMIRVSPEERIKIQRMESKIINEEFQLPDNLNPMDDIC